MSSTMTPNATALSQPVLMHHDRIRDRLIRSQLDKDRGRLFAKNPTKELLKFWESHPDSDGNVHAFYTSSEAFEQKPTYLSSLSLG